MNDEIDKDITAELDEPQLDDVMIDLETLSTNQDAAILSIGAVRFNPNTGEIADTFHERIDFNSAIVNGHVSMDTLKFWFAADGNAGKLVASGTRMLPEALTEFAEWLGQGSIVWGNGATFDITILENTYKRLEMDTPWKFYDVRDCRTVEAMAESICERSEFERSGTHHDALDDAKYQAEYISGMWQKMRVLALAEAA